MSANYRHIMLEDLTEWAVPKPDDSHHTTLPNRTPSEVRVAECDAAFFSLLAEIQTTLRCKFFTYGVYGSDNGVNGDDTDVVYIGYDGCAIDAAHVRWHHGEMSPRFVISSPSVCNHKYADYNPKHDEITTTIPRSFITNVKRHARIILDGEEAEKLWQMNMELALGDRSRVQRPREWFHTDADRHRADVSDARFSLSSYYHPTGNFTTTQLESALNTELLHLHRSGHTFITEEIAECVGILDRAQRALDELNNTVSRVLYVKYITPDTFKVCISLEPDTYQYRCHSDTFCAYSVPLTDSAMSRVGALSICDRHQPVEGIGIRVGATSFLVYAD